MLKTLAFTLLLVATALPAAATEVKLCDGQTLCPYVVAEPPARVCAGLGFGLQGVIVCGTQGVQGTCVEVRYGFNEIPACSTLEIGPLPLP